jgi:hypothetical protein
MGAITQESALGAHGVIAARTARAAIRVSTAPALKIKLTLTICNQTTSSIWSKSLPYWCLSQKAGNLFLENEMKTPHGYKLQTDVKILRGLTLTIEFYVAPSEPDIGRFDDYIDDWEIVAVAGRGLKQSEKTDWIKNNLTIKDQAMIENHMHKAIEEDLKNSVYETIGE